MLEVVDKCLPFVKTNIDAKEFASYFVDISDFDLKNIKTHTYPSNEDKDVCINPDSMGGYLLDSYSNQVIDLHNFIYEIDDYKPSQRIYDNERLTYDTYGDFYESNNLIP